MQKDRGIVNGSWRIPVAVMNLDKLEVWARAKDFTLVVYKEVIPCLPADETWNLVSQSKRAAQSIPAIIAAGHGGYHFLDNVRFCCIARGSLTEVQSRTSLAYELGYLPDEIFTRLTVLTKSVGKQPTSHIAYLKRFKQGEKEFQSSYTVREEVDPYHLDNQDESTPH